MSLLSKTANPVTFNALIIEVKFPSIVGYQLSRMKMGLCPIFGYFNKIVLV